MRILMTTDTVGGVWTFTQQLTQELLRVGHSVALVSVGRLPSPAQLGWCRSLRSLYKREFRFMTSSAPLEWMPQNDAAYSSAAPLLISLAAKFSPDILLTSQFCYGALPLDIPKVVVAHSDVLSWGQACRAGMLPKTPWLLTYINLVSKGIEAASAVVAPTHWMLAALAANFTLSDCSVVIPNGFDASASANTEPRQHQAVSAGRFWDEAKNLNILQGIASELPIVVAGSISSTHDTDHSRRLRFIGELSQNDVLALYRRSSIYICTSIYEPFGLAPLEAALCGCAILANDIPSLREVWKDGAIFFRGPGELEQKILSLRERDALRNAQQQSFARASIYTSTRMTESYLNLFGRLLKSDLTECRRNAHAA